ncbi:hypothetical protein T03_5627 [Trichinella britovi]|uniref:Uncharacterized protein n=1 Tax=Trichinella britovi TaxID=45882 RepID=A0A0V1CVU1_TRIBR|nr:hypothetical protein T03_5627 [Trichinella britovi]
MDCTTLILLDQSSTGYSETAASSLASTASRNKNSNARCSLVGGPRSTRREPPIGSSLAAGALAISGADLQPRRHPIK